MSGKNKRKDDSKDEKKAKKEPKLTSDSGDNWPSAWFIDAPILLYVACVWCVSSRVCA
jgi:hypothetical protein